LISEANSHEKFHKVKLPFKTPAQMFMHYLMEKADPSLKLSVKN